MSKWSIWLLEKLTFWPCLPSLWSADIEAALLGCEISHVSLGNSGRCNVSYNPRLRTCKVSVSKENPWESLPLFSKQKTLLFSYRIFVGLFVFGPIWRIGKLLGAIELLSVFTIERFVTGMRPHVNFPIFWASKSSIAIFVLQKETRNLWWHLSSKCGETHWVWHIELRTHVTTYLTFKADLCFHLESRELWQPWFMGHMLVSSLLLLLRWKMSKICLETLILL